MSGSDGARRSLQEHLRASLSRTRTRSERHYSHGRAAFCAAVLARFLLIRAGEPEGLTGTGTYVNTVGVGALIAFSLWLARHLRKQPASTGMLTLSIAVDAFGCFVSLAQDVLWPAALRASDYSGLLAHPDIFAQLIIMMGSAVRLSPILVAWSGALNLSCAILLLWIDHARWDGFQGYVREEISLYLLCMLTVALLAAAASVVLRRLLLGVATERWRIRCARSNLAVLASEHHDVKSLLSAATLRLELWRERHEAGAGDRDVVDATVLSDLALLGSQIELLCERTFGEITRLQSPEPVAIQGCLERALGFLRHRFSTLDLQLALRPLPEVHLPGGESAFSRIVFNLVSNAQRGNGRRGARRVLVAADVERDAVRLRVHDDGPGFPATPPPALSSKADGTGVGLQLIRQLVGASGGSVEMARSELLSGACVTLRWPVSSAAARATPLGDRLL